MNGTLPDDPREFSETELLIQINLQLEDLREQNERLIQLLSDDVDEEQYKCLSCGDHVPEDERDAHQIRKHSAPPAGVDLTAEYTAL